MSLSAIFRETFFFFRNHLRQLAVLTVPLLLIQVGLQFWLGNQMRTMDMDKPEFHSGHMLAMMVLLLVFSWLIAALTLLLEWRSEGHQPSNKQVLLTSLQFVPPLLLAGVLSGLAIIGPSLLAAAFGPLWIVGLAISIFLFARLAYVNFMVITERLTPLAAIKSSFVFSKVITLKTMMILFLYVPLSLLGGVISHLVAAGGLPLQLIVETAIAFFGLFINIALFRLYMVTRQQAAK